MPLTLPAYVEQLTKTIEKLRSDYFEMKHIESIKIKVEKEVKQKRTDETNEELADVPNEELANVPNDEVAELANNIWELEKRIHLSFQVLKSLQEDYSGQKK